MEHRLLHDPSLAKMLDHDPLQEFRCNARIPDALGVNHDDRSAGADAQARRLAALHAIRPEEEPFALEERREKIIELSAAALRRAKGADAHEHVARVRLHEWLRRDGIWHDAR
jgi:hypothetical protein